MSCELLINPEVQYSEKWGVLETEETKNLNENIIITFSYLN
jgi:hypothetical protein